MGSQQIAEEALCHKMEGKLLILLLCVTMVLAEKSANNIQDKDFLAVDLLSLRLGKSDQKDAFLPSQAQFSAIHAGFPASKADRLRMDTDRDGESSEPFVSRDINFRSSRASNFRSPVIVPLAGKKAKVIGIVSIFLNVHPFGASVDYIWSYLINIDPTLSLSEVENILRAYTDCFELTLTGVGAAIERKWIFVAFKTQ